MKQPDISSLALISDRQTCALLDKEGTISWYCPVAFDRPAILSSLIDEEQGGYWRIDIRKGIFTDRNFAGRSSVLHTRFDFAGTELELTDFMAIGADFKGICRMISKAPEEITGQIILRGNYGVERFVLEQPSVNSIKAVSIEQWLHCSHPLQIEDGVITYSIPEGKEGWVALIDSEHLDRGDVDNALKSTLAAWQQIEKHIDYVGPFQKEVCNSLRAIQQLVYEPTGGIIAAPTTGLPEVIGGERNYDYRYVWMRDAALITSSLTGIITDGKVERNFISFVAGAMKKNKQAHVSCFYGIDQSIKNNTKELPVSGYRQSRPVMAGNSAIDQFQLDAESNILLACKLIYDKYDEKIEWDTVEIIADYICRNWEREDNGIWEESITKHYTNSKLCAARGLELMAAYQDEEETAQRWLKNASMIRDFITKNCMTKTGAYAVYAGSQDVDISAALFPIWNYDEPDSSAMLATIEQLEKDYCRKGLYWRHLEEFDSAKEGAFLAGSCWMAHYYAVAGDTDKSKQILDSILEFSNDLGYFSEEADVDTHELLGNFPQTFVHSSFISAVNGYRLALDHKKSILA